MSEKSFWENLGRSFGYGVRKVKRVGERLSDEAEGLLDVKEARERLEGLHRMIGQKVCDAALEEEPNAVDIDDELRELIRKVRETGEKIARFEAEAKAEADAETEETEAETETVKRQGRESEKQKPQRKGTETAGDRESGSGEPSGQDPKDD